MHCTAAHPAEPDVVLLQCALVGQHARSVLVDADNDTSSVSIQLHQIVKLILATQGFNTWTVQHGIVLYASTKGHHQMNMAADSPAAAMGLHPRPNCSGP